MDIAKLLIKIFFFKEHSHILNLNELFFSVSDAWEASVAVDLRVASTSASKVLERHAAMASKDVIMPPVYPVPSKNSKIQAMQRLATQKGFFDSVKIYVHFLIELTSL